MSIIDGGLGKILGRLSHQTNAEEEILSPDGRVSCKFFIRQGHISYNVSYQGVVIVKNSRLGFKLKDEKSFGENLALVRVRNGRLDETWETVWGEDRYVRNHYNEKIFYLEETNGENRLTTLKFRVFDDGVGFRYEIPPQPSFSRIIIEDELTEFHVDGGSSAWCIPANQADRYEYNYEKKTCYELTSAVHTPLTIRTTQGPYVSIHEAALYDYGEMTIVSDDWGALKADICPLNDGMKAYVELPFSTPWRVIMIADRAVDLVKNRIVLNLNDKPRQDFEWVKPLKFLGIWWAMYVGEWTWKEGDRHGASTNNTMEYIDAAERLGIEGLLLEGWNNGWEGDWLKNGQYTVFTQPASDLDFDKVCKYAAEKNIEIVGHHETVGFVDNYEKQLDDAYKYYSDRGVHYVKSGYAGSSMLVRGKKEYHHSQAGVKHYQRALELAAKYHICLDVHEPIKGTGIERTWPNLLSKEGARGQEYEGGALSPSHGVNIPFTRCLAGPFDYTPGIFDISNNTKRIASTLARQLAYYVTIPSGMVMAADRPKFYEEVQPEAFHFIRDVPINWEESRPLVGEIGEYYVVARRGRDSEDWYIGGLTNESERNFRVRLNFLDYGEYTADIYKDAKDAHFRDNPLAIKLESFDVTRNDMLDIYVTAGGGFAVRLKKK